MQAVLEQLRQEAEHIITFRFRPERPLDYSAGQFIELTLPHDNPDERGKNRWFTLSSSPTEELAAITVKFQDSRSSLKRALRQLHVGDIIQISDPLGDFVLPLDESVPLIWIAGGIGITPFRSMSQWIADKNEIREITLFHSYHQTDEALFTDILQRANVVGVDQHTRPSAPQMLATMANISDISQKLFYISGPEPFIETLSHDLQAHGINRERIVTDAFLGYA